MSSLYIFIPLILIAVAILARNVRIVPQSQAYVIEKLGAYKTTWEVGLKFKMPFLESIRSKVSLKEKVVDFPPQPVITKDNVTMQIDTVVYYQITDPKLFTYGVDNPIAAIENLTATTLRNIIGTLELDESLSSRDTINTQMRATLDEATDPWGIKVNRVEVKNIEPPKDIQDAMEKQMRAERERREAILKAEGQKRSAILKSEGEKEAAIRKAEGEKASNILRAEGKAKSILLEAQAEAKALLAVQNIEPNDRLLALKKVEALSDLGKGRATKIVLPTELASLGSLVSAGSELLKDIETPNVTQDDIENALGEELDNLHEDIEREDIDISEIEDELPIEDRNETLT